MIKHRTMKLALHCTAEKSWPSLNFGVIVPPGPTNPKCCKLITSQNVNNGWLGVVSVGKAVRNSVCRSVHTLLKENRHELTPKSSAVTRYAFTLRPKCQDRALLVVLVIRLIRLLRFLDAQMLSSTDNGFIRSIRGG